MRILFIGGNGNISWHCVQKAIESGHEVWELNRALTRGTRREVQPQVSQIICDVRNADDMDSALGNITFDVICDFICYNREQAKNALSFYRERTKQYVYISSDAVYARKSSNLPFREDAEQYSSDVPDAYIAGKIHAESVFSNAYEKHGFPVTIVRPGYTYDTIIPAPIGHNCFTAPQKYVNGYPLLMPGDGMNLWAPLHSRDFAEAFNCLLANPCAIGNDFHITSDFLMTWNELAEQLLSALRVENPTILHIPYDEAIKLKTFHSEIITRQNMWHHVYDNSKIMKVTNGWKAKITFNEGIAESVEWLYDKDVRRRINHDHDIVLEEIYSKYWSNKENR